MVIAAELEKQKAENNRLLWGFWHGEALRRVKRLPDLNRLMGKPVEAQSDEEMWAAWEGFVASHNARYYVARRLGLNTE